MKSFLRFLWRNRLYTAIEVVGMAVAIAFVIFIASFIIGEMSYDRQLRGTDDIYVGHSERLFIGSATVKGQVEGRFPEVRNICRMTSTGIFAGVRLSAEINNVEIRNDALIVDENFFDLFTFPLVSGSPDTALKGMNSVAISEDFARRHFDGQDPIGQNIRISINGAEEILDITAIFKDFKNTVFPAHDMIYRFDLLGRMYPDMVDNGSGIAVNFYQLTPGTDAETLSGKMEEIVREEDYIYKFDVFHDYRLSPFKDIHFGILDESTPFEGIVNKDFIRLFIAAGILLLVFALLNYISLTVAQTGFRAKEMATRRLLGSQKSGIIFRYIAEASGLTLISFILALVFVDLFDGPMSELIGKDISPLSGTGIAEIIFYIILPVLLSLCSGLIPALVVSRYNPIDVVKGTFAKISRMTLGRIFIIMQNAVAVATLAMAIVMMLQIRHMSSKPMGYERDNIISVAGVDKASDYHIDELRQLSCVESAGWLMWNPMGNSHAGQGFKKNGETLHFDMYFGDQEAFNILGFKVLRKNAEPVSQSMWLTESTMRTLGLGYDCTSVELDGGGMLPVCGIIQDFKKGNSESTNEFLLCAWIKEMEKPEDFQRLRELAVKVSGNENDAAEAIREFYREKGFNDETIHVKTYNEINMELYSNEDRNLKLIAVFTMLILLLSAMAMVAMSTYYAKQHAKQTAIRKVMGCSRAQIYADTAKGFLLAVGIAVIVAVPCSFIVAGKWLEGYSYRIDNSLWIYLAAATVIAAVAVMSISWQAVRLMDTDPAEALKSE